MLIFTIRRLLASILVLLVSSFVVYLFAAASFDPLAPYRQKQPLPPQSFFDAQSKALGLNHPILDRYWIWLKNAVQFKFGNDVNAAPVGPQLATRLEITARMIIAAIVLGVIVAVVVGVIAGVRRGKSFDVVTTVLTFMLIALPTFWFAALLKQQAINVNNATGSRFFQTTGQESFGASDYLSGWALWQDRLEHLILPTVSLALLYAAGWIRYQRASMIDVIDADYMRLARAKGIRWPTVVRRHGLRNALIPLTTVVALDVGALFGGAIITEKVYVWHGLGEFFNTALQNQDINSVVAWVMLSALFVVLFNLIADLLYATLDPRIRLA